METLRSIRWNRFTDNFIRLYGQSRDNPPNWFDDSLWQTVIANMRLLSKGLVAGRCKGVMFDPENYNYNQPNTYTPWTYEPNFPGRSFDEVKTKVRQRGKELMTALQSETGGIRFLMTLGPQQVQTQILG